MERITLNIKEISQQLGVSLPVAYDVARQDGFPALRVGRRILVPRVAFENWLRDSATNRIEIETSKG